MSKSVTIHMGLGITEDIDLELEELSRLRRLGNFTAAQRFLKENLPGRLDDPYFFVLNAQLLLEMGDFRSFDTLRPTRVFGDMKDAVVQKNQDLLRVSWNLHILLAMLPGRDCTKRAMKEIDSALAFLEARAELGSTEVRLKQGLNFCYAFNVVLLIWIKIQILTTIFRLIRYLAHSLGLQSPQLRDVKNVAQQWTDWASVYHHLASEGRVWDFRDIFTAFKLAFGIDRAFDAFFNTGSLDEIMETLDSDWETVDYDESTNLALLDIMASLVLESDFENTPLHIFQTCLEHGEKLVESLIDEHPETMNSRPFARWIVAKAAVLSCDAHGNPFSSFRFLDSYPGMQVRQGGGVNIPIYVPLRSERPTWQVPEAPLEWKEAVQMALRTAKNLGDYETQALCLKHLIVRSHEPRRLLGELSDLQNLIQDDQDGYLRTCLSKLLILTDFDSQRQLAEELFRFKQDKAIINQELPIEHHNVSLQWARSVILPTLPATIGGIPTMDKSGSFYARLPTYIRQFIDVRETFHTQSRPMNAFPASGAKLRQWSLDNIVEEDIERSTRLVPESEALIRPGIRRVQTLQDDAGSDRFVFIQSRHSHAVQRKIDRQNERISQRGAPTAKSVKLQTGGYTDDSWSTASRFEKPIHRDTYRDEAVQTPVTGRTRREISRERTGTAKRADTNQAHAPNANADDVLVVNIWQSPMSWPNKAHDPFVTVAVDPVCGKGECELQRRQQVEDVMHEAVREDQA
ncbi:hypothetical protein DL765_002537 [Monosporascus sp. GIB2]|nr:hypothetical protein DL765_002537 [Monosporascus sp. GIB2]